MTEKKNQMDIQLNKLYEITKEVDLKMHKSKTK